MPANIESILAIVPFKTHTYYYTYNRMDLKSFLLRTTANRHHRKLAILDRDVLREGSLTIFPQHR